MKPRPDKCAWCQRLMPVRLPRGRIPFFCRPFCRLRYWRWSQPTEDQLHAGDRFDVATQRYYRTESSRISAKFWKYGEPLRSQCPVPPLRLGRIR